MYLIGKAFSKYLPNYSLLSVQFKDGQTLFFLFSYVLGNHAIFLIVVSSGRRVACPYRHVAGIGIKFVVHPCHRGLLDRFPERPEFEHIENPKGNVSKTPGFGHPLNCSVVCWQDHIFYRVRALATADGRNFSKEAATERAPELFAEAVAQMKIFPLVESEWADAADAIARRGS